MNKSLYIFLIFFVISVNSLVSLDKNEVIEYYNSKMKDLNSVSFSFSDLNSKNIAGSVKALKGNYYKISTANRIVFCDGKKISNYTNSDNKVLISDFDQSRAGLSIENIFFNIFEKMTVETFKKEHSSKRTKGLYELEFKLNSEYSSKNKISNIKIWLTEKKEIKFIATVNKMNTQMWEINNLVFNPPIDKEIFNFKIPKNCRIIELD